MDALIELEHCDVARGSMVVLRDVSLTVREGEHVVILGPNGCGKSTLLKTMTCDIYPVVKDGMRVRILGRERWDLTELKRRLGVVSDELPGRPTLRTTGRDAVLTGFFSSSTLWPNLVVTAEMRARADSRARWASESSEMGAWVLPNLYLGSAAGAAAGSLPFDVPRTPGVALGSPALAGGPPLDAPGIAASVPPAALPLLGLAPC